MFNAITTFITGVTLAIGSIFNPVPLELPEPIVQPVYEDQNLGAFAPAAGGTYRLKSSIGTTNTTITLSSLKEPVSDDPFTMDKLATDIGYGTLDPQSSTRKEFISFTGITQNADGSAQLTGVTRGLSGSSPFTASSTLRKSHPGQSIFILSDSPQLFNEYARRRSDESVTGYWSFPTPTGENNPATKAYVDSVVTGGAVTLDGIAMAATAGETFATGTVVYFDDGADEWLKASAATLASSTNVQLGIAQGAGTNGTAINGGVLTRGYDETQVGMTAGNTIYLSDTAGATSTSAGTYSVILGQARSTTQLYFDPIYGNIVHVSADNTLTGNNTFSGSTTTFSGSTTTFSGATTTFSGSLVDFSGVTDITGHASTTFTVYTASTTWSKPAGLEYIEVWVCGGGGGGATNGVTDIRYPGGGGAGACAFENLTASELSATTSVAIIVGLGGAAETAGETSSFGNFLSATGGAAGTDSTGSSPGGGLGGTATGGDINLAGGDGYNAARANDNTANAPALGGNGGGSTFSGGGRGGVSSVGQPGRGYGAGGGAAGNYDSDLAGGVGYQGFVSIKAHF